MKNFVILENAFYKKPLEYQVVKFVRAILIGLSTRPGKAALNGLKSIVRP